MAYYLANGAATSQILDARAEPRFLGDVKEPRKGVRSGHITGSKNMPFGELIDGETGGLKSDKELSKIFLERDIDTTVRTLNSCGSGVTACIVDLALKVVGAENNPHRLAHIAREILAASWGGKVS